MHNARDREYRELPDTLATHERTLPFRRLGALGRAFLVSSSEEALIELRDRHSRAIVGDDDLLALFLPAYADFGRVRVVRVRNKLREYGRGVAVEVDATFEIA